MKKGIALALLALAWLVASSNALPHSGGQDKHGCHAGSQKCHCHRGKPSPMPVTVTKPDGSYRCKHPTGFTPPPVGPAILWGALLLLVVFSYFALWNIRENRNLREAIKRLSDFALLNIRENKNPREAIEKLSDEEREKTRDIPPKHMQPLTGKEHHDYLMRSMGRAQSKLIILSGVVAILRSYR